MTRADLLREVHGDLTAAERDLLSVRRALPVLGWSIGVLVATLVDVGPSDVGLFLALGLVWWAVARLVPGAWWVGHLVAAGVTFIVGVAALPWFEDTDHQGTVTAVAGIGIGLGLVAATAAYVRQSTRLRRRIEASESRRRQPAVTALVDGHDLPVAALTVREADPRAAEVVPQRLARLFDLRLAVPSFLLMVTGVFGLGFAGSWAAGVDGGPTATQAVGGLLLTVPFVWALVDLLVVSGRRQQEANRSFVDAQIVALRAAGDAAPAGPRPHRANLFTVPFGGLLAGAWIVVLLLRLRSASPAALVASLVIAVLAVVITAAVVLRRRRTTRIYPLDGRGDSLLQEPAADVVLDWTGSALRLSDRTGKRASEIVEASRVRSIATVTGLHAVAGTGVAIVTDDRAIVLAGGGVETSDALSALRGAVGQRS